MKLPHLKWQVRGLGWRRFVVVVGGSLRCRSFGGRAGDGWRGRGGATPGDQWNRGWP